MKKTIALSIVCLALLAFQIRYGLVPAWRTVQSDFPNYYTAARLLSDGQASAQFYDDDWFQRQIRGYGMEAAGKFAPFPPATAFVMLPLSGFSPLTAKRIWTVINLLALLANIWLLRQLSRQSYLHCAVFLLLGGFGLANTFKLGQFYLILLLLILLAAFCVLRKRDGLAGILLGLGASIKYLPIIYVLGFGLNRRPRLIVAGLVTIGGVMLLEAAVFGTDVHFQFIRTILLPHLNGVLQTQDPFTPTFQSWNSLLRNIFVYDPLRNPHPLIPWPTGFLIARTVILLLIFGSAARTIYRLHGAEAMWLRLSIIGLAVMAALPASATYHFILLAFPVAILWRYADQPGLRYHFWTVYVLYAAIGLLPVHYFSGFRYAGGWIFLAYPRLFLMTSLFITGQIFVTAVVRTGLGRLSIKTVETVSAM